MAQPATASSFMPKDSMPHQSMTEVGPYRFFEWNDNQYYLVNTSTGITFKAAGELTKLEHLMPVYFENSKGEMSSQPDADQQNIFSGRFVFSEFQNKYFVLDTVGGNLWTLKGTVKNPEKFVLVPRKVN